MQIHNYQNYISLFIAITAAITVFLWLFLHVISLFFIVPKIEKKYKTELQLDPYYKIHDPQIIGLFVCNDIVWCYLNRKKKPRYIPKHVLNQINYKIEKEKKIIIFISFAHDITFYTFLLSFILWHILYFGFDWGR